MMTRREFHSLLAAGAAVSPKTGLVRVTRSPRLGQPVHVPAGQTWTYLLTFPFQVGPHEAAVLLNIKQSPAPGVDCPAGYDVVVFRDRLRVLVEEAVAVGRTERDHNPNAGGQACEMRKTPGQVSFVPLGARRSDGSAHPHAGTGIIIGESHAWPADGSLRAQGVERSGTVRWTGDQAYARLQVSQVAFDGRRFQVTRQVTVERGDLLPGWTFSMLGMTVGIPDGDDMLAPASAFREGRGKLTAGVMRIRRTGGEWRVAGFQPVTPEDGSMEASLIRDRDGEFLFAARGTRQSGHPIRVWRSSGQGQRWELTVFCGGISSAPIVLNKALDGTPFIAANRYQYQTHVKGVPSMKFFLGKDGRPVEDGGTRETLMLWPLNEARDALEIPVYGRDCLTELGPPPYGTVWGADHPNASVVRLADGRWQCLMGYRIFEKEENFFGAMPTKYTGAYLEEVVSSGRVVAPWNFG